MFWQILVLLLVAGGPARFRPRCGGGGGARLPRPRQHHGPRRGGAVPGRGGQTADLGRGRWQNILYRRQCRHR